MVCNYLSAACGTGPLDSLDHWQRMVKEVAVGTPPRFLVTRD